MSSDPRIFSTLHASHFQECRGLQRSRITELQRGLDTGPTHVHERDPEEKARRRRTEYHQSKGATKGRFKANKVPREVLVGIQTEVDKPIEDDEYDEDAPYLWKESGILQIRGEQRGMLLQLGYLLDDPDATGQILFPSDNHIAICTHNDNAIQLPGSTFNHYSGVELPPSESSFGFGSISAVTSENEPVVWGKTETVAPENVWANDKAVGMTRLDDGWGTAPGFKFGGSTEEPEEESVGNAKAAWTAGQNKLVDDVADGWNRMMMMMIMTYKSCYFGGEETNDKTEEVLP
ncbi:hypothetical protein DER45DRAFT_532327 [Fusarium avenaceum]|nr:hypothetical protein DER45DRAFT_532327 [Fusarium avenaceum]